LIEDMKQFSKRIHMVGIGGAGMSPLAEMLHSHGHTITGSDRARSVAALHLESIGIPIQYDHTPDLVKNAELIAYTSAVKSDNAERLYAREHGIPEMRRADALGDIMRSHFTICIAGTHGKTTTTSMVGTVFQKAGRNPTVLVGGTLRGTGSNAVVGEGRLLIAEADEYDRSFLSMYPSLAIITNIEADHLDCYRDLDDIKSAFVQYCRRLPFYGAVIACNDDSGVRDILPRLVRKVITYGVNSIADYMASAVSFTDGKPSFTVLCCGKEIGEMTLAVPGLHNVANSLAAIASGTEMGIDFETIRNALISFEGVHRRFEIVGTAGGVTVVDDYAHHPGEIKATIDAARKSGHKRVVAVFQPHLYTRTRDFMSEFAQSLGAADETIVTAIYKSREEPIPGITAEAIIVKMKAAGNRAEYVNDMNRIPALLKSRIKAGDIVVFMGAGDIGEVAARFAAEMTPAKELENA